MKVHWLKFLMRRYMQYQMPWNYSIILNTQMDVAYKHNLLRVKAFRHLGFIISTYCVSLNSPLAGLFLIQILH